NGRVTPVPAGPTIIGTVSFLTRPPVFGAALWIALAICPPVYALSSSVDISQYAHTVWTVKDGFVGGVLTIAQTADGYLWVGGPGGLFRFDGIRAVPWPLPSQ